MKNKRIKEALFKTQIRQYELVSILGISESTLTRKLRNELPDEEQDKIVRLIYQEHTKRTENND